MKIKKDFMYSGDGIMAEACEFELNEGTIENIKKAQKLLEENKFVDGIKLNIWIDLTLFNSTLDDEEVEAIDTDDWDYFRTDTQIINVHKHYIYLRCYGKYDSSQYFEVDLSNIINDEDE